MNIMKNFFFVNSFHLKKSVPLSRNRGPHRRVFVCGVGRRRISRLALSSLLICFLVISLAPCLALGESSSNSARELVQQVIDNELAYNRSDHSHWMYLDSDKKPGKDVLQLVVQTPNGTLSKALQMNGHPLTDAERQADQSKMESIVNDPSARAKQKKNSEHDDQQVVSLMKMLPKAFLWTQTGESNGEIALSYKPDPSFQPPTYAARVFAAMAGKMVVDAKQKRLKEFSGKLIHPVEFGWGLLGKIQQGGTFHVHHTEVAPGKWEVTETHVHINGRILFFKSLVSQQEDDISSHYKPTPPHTSLKQAAQMLNDGTVAKEIGVPEK